MLDLVPIKTQINSRVNILTLIIFFIIFVPSSFHPIFESISLYLLIPLLFLYSLIKYPKLILNYRPLFYLFLIFCWSLITIIKSENLDISLSEIRTLVGVFMLCYIFVYYCSVNTKYIYVFYLLYILKFFTALYFAYSHNLFASDEAFFNIKELNANEFGYFGFFSIVSAFFLWQRVNHNLIVKLTFLVIFGLCLSFSVVSCFLAASRAGIAISILTSTILIIIYFFYPLSKKALWGIILLIIIGMSIVSVLNSYYHGSILESRFNIESVQNESRYNLIMRAFEVGCQNPVFGVGPGNYELYSGTMLFSHSTYMELFANNGIFALLLFISILYYFFKKNIQLYSLGEYRHKNALYFFCFILIYSAYNFFYVFHTSLFMMGFFYIVYVHMDISFDQE
jgi:O-Antigen ligase